MKKPVNNFAKIPMKEARNSIAMLARRDRQLLVELGGRGSVYDAIISSPSFQLLLLNEYHLTQYLEHLLDGVLENCDDVIVKFLKTLEDGTPAHLIGLVGRDFPEVDASAFALR